MKIKTSSVTHNFIPYILTPNNFDKFIVIVTRAQIWRQSFLIFFFFFAHMNKQCRRWRRNIFCIHPPSISIVDYSILGRKYSPFFSAFSFFDSRFLSCKWIFAALIIFWRLLNDWINYKIRFGKWKFSLYL